VGPTSTGLLKEAGPGDVLAVTRLDRLARSTRDLLNVLDASARRMWASSRCGRPRSTPPRRRGGSGQHSVQWRGMTTIRIVRAFDADGNLVADNDVVTDGAMSDVVTDGAMSGCR
jgi:Resolvase, N terminal domain